VHPVNLREQEAGALMRTVGSFFFVSIIAFTPALSARADDPCPSVGRVAESVMKRRQDGQSLQSTLEVIKSTTSKEAGSLMETMIMAAYDVPLYATPKNKDRAIGEFRDDQQLACMKLVRQP
jgi:hypothetical protein